MLSSFTVYDSIAVCIHPNWPVYRNFKWQPLIPELGVRRVRGLLGRQKTDLPFLKPLFDAGVKVCATMVASSGGTLDKADAEANIGAVETLWGPQNVFAMEGPNEFNNYSSDANYLRDFVEWFHGRVRSRPALNSVKIVAPSVFKRDLAFYKALGSLDPWVDLGCMHYYTDRKRPTVSNTSMDQAFVNAHILTPKPIVVTETGYSNHVSAKVKAKYTLRVFLELIKRGAGFAANYELFDSKADPLWGLTDAALAKRPAFNSVKNLVAILKDTPCTPADYTPQITGPADLVKMTIGRSDGSHMILLWKDVNSTDNDVTSPVTVTLPAVPTRVDQMLPTFDSGIKTIPPTKTLTLQVPDHVMILRVAH